MGDEAGLEREDLPDATMRALIDEQFPWLAERELGRRYTLEDHLSVRIGDDYGAIFPRFERDDALFARVADLLRPVASTWSFYASYPVATGVPGHGYPYHWVIVEWNAASIAGYVPLLRESAAPLGKAIREIHVPSPAGAPVNPVAGTGLESKRAEVESALEVIAANAGPTSPVIDADATLEVFNAGVEVDIDVDKTWTHGRLEARSVLSDRGTFDGIVLWYKFGAGDPAADLGYAANLIPLAWRQDLWSGYGEVNEAMALRAGAFQIYVALRYIKNGDPFLLHMAWDRLLELGLAHKA